MQAVLWPIVQWLIQKSLIQFVVFAAVFALVALVVPMAVDLLAPFLGINLSVVFSGIPPSVWWIVDAFRLDFGLPLMISALVARFMIRRLPVIG